MIFFSIIVQFDFSGFGDRRRVSFRLASADRLPKFDEVRLEDGDPQVDAEHSRRPNPRHYGRYEQKISISKANNSIIIFSRFLEKEVQCLSDY